MNPTRYTRTPYLIVSRDLGPRKEIYGSIGDAVVLQAQLLRGDEPSTTVVIGMHPVGSPGYLPAFSQLARAGHHVIACATRYSMGDAALQMENALLDLAACVRDAKERLGYERVILAGWSGGGALMAGYQAEAEKRVITRTAAGEETALAETELIPGDALAVLAAHRSRHHLLTDFLDPSILDEDRPDEREPELNIYDARNPNQPPYTDEYIQRYRAAQHERNNRITERALSRLSALRSTGRGVEDHCFVVHGTMADLRWLDPAVDPNDRIAGHSYLGDPRIANESTAGLARFTTTRGWLSQWSMQHAQVDAVDSADRITVPVLVIVNSADDACPPSHPHDFFAGIQHDRKELHTIDGANHYFSGGDSRQHLDVAADLFGSWTDRYDLGRAR
ncbi:alpha/beta hydrolase [Pseudarthrobacter sp. B4EP4b]|uniref:alpha/beta hydrolase family protein n=1 Tax=Pseudarthrobacter sp. B4EP4b TaxID=2590664 RepID=UPI0011522330|nr:alpha/beta hydrolase [Pseudarthrobacter sp. B4EP4b]